MKLKTFLQDTLSMGKGSMKLSINSTIEKYRNDYKIITMTQKKQFKSDVYSTPSGRVIVHVKVPSQSLEKFYYDVLIELITSPGVKSFEDCDIRIFSNSPSFVYYYAYVFYHLNAEMQPANKDAENSGMIIDLFKGKVPRDRLLLAGTERKIGDDVLENEPVIRNPYGVPLFDKSLYLAVFYMLEKLNFNQVIHNHRKYPLNQIINNVETFDQLMLLRKKEEESEKNRKRKEKRTVPKQITNIEKTVAKVNAGTAVRQMEKPKSAHQVKSTIDIRKSGGIKRIGR